MTLRISLRRSSSFLALGLVLSTSLLLSSASASEAVSLRLTQLHRRARSQAKALLGKIEALKATSPTDRDDPRAALVQEARAWTQGFTREVQETLRQAEKEKFQPDFDLVVVGGGVHSGILTRRLAGLSPEAKIAVVEAGPKLGRVFAQAGAVFRINSPETEKGSTNVLPGAPIQLREMTSQKFAKAELLGEAVYLCHATSFALPVLKTKALSMQEVSGGVQVRLSQGGAVRARAVVLATGLGVPRLPSKDPGTLKLIREYQGQKIGLGDAPDLEFFDGALRRAAAASEHGVQPLTAYKGKRVAVVGAGDGANVWVEFLLGKAPGFCYAGDPSPRIGSELLWINQKAETHADFVARNKPRYHKTFESLYAEGSFQAVPHRLGAIRKASDPSQGKFELEMADGSTQVADKVILCTGYKNLAPWLAQGLDPQAQFEPFSSTDPGPSTLVARQYRGQKSYPVYLIGAGAAPLATEQELKESATMNSVSINVLAPRSYRFAKSLEAILSGAR